jgi:hypothetical protein
VGYLLTYITMSTVVVDTITWCFVGINHLVDVCLVGRLDVESS